MARGKDRRRSARKPALTVAPPHKRPWILVAAAVIVAGVVTIVIARRGDPPVAVPVDAAVVIAKPIAAPAPVPPPANPYVGSAKCGECHADELAAWKTSWHAKALAPGDRASIVGNFANAHFTGTSSEAWMKRTGDRSIMRATGPDGALADYPVDWVIGGKRMQDNVTVFPDGRWQVLPIYFHVTGKAWVDYTETKQGALTPAHPFYWTNVRRMANHECLDCHTTGLRVDYDVKAAHWNTTFVDGNVACEDCHGPGGRHSATKAIADIVHPVDAGTVGLASCIRCHGPRKPLWPLLDPEHQFEPARDGNAYDELYEPIVVALPDGVSSDFFADGRPRTSSFEYQAMLQSACYRKGKATCLTCHTAPHETKRRAELRVDPDETCRSCHADVIAQGKAHTHHAAASCTACHMPPVVSGVLDHFVDHAIDVPDPQNAARHAVPDACGVCHPKKSSTELQASLLAWWPAAAKRQARRERLADAFDETTAKDSARPLVGVIDDRDEAPTLRGAAMIVTARRFGAASAPKLAQYLDDASLILRAKACEALGAARAVAAADRVAPHLTDPVLRVHLACALALFDMHDPRGEPALQALADDPKTSRLTIPHRELGVLKGRRRDFAGARRELEIVAQLAPYSPDALVELAGVDAELGEFAAAHARVDQALALEPHHAGALALRAKLP